MKKITLCLMLILALIVPIVPRTIFATESIVEVSSEEELATALSKGGNIKLTGNIDVGKFVGVKFTIPKNVLVTLDLNGKTISGENSDETVNTSLIINNGTLNIVDNSIDQKGKITLSDTGVKLNTWGIGIYTICNYGILTVNSGTIENTGTTDVPYAIDNQSSASNTKLTINGGNITSKICAIRVCAMSETFKNETIIENGNISGNTAIWLQQPSKKALKASLIINGGTLSGTTGRAVYADIYNDANASKAISITITGGTIENDSETKPTLGFVDHFDLDDDGDTIDKATLNLNISGGTIRNKNSSEKLIMDAKYTTINKNNIKITGGKYSSEIDNDFLANGVISKKIDDLYWVGTEHKITVKEAEGGKIIVREVRTLDEVKETDKAISGETVEIVVEPAEGYKFKGISGVDGIKDVAEYAYQFTMPNKDVDLIPVFEKITTEAKVPSNVVNDEKVEEMLIETLKENEKFAEIIKDKNVEIKVEVKEKEVTSSEKEAIKSAASKEVAGIKVVNYIDITIYVKDADNGKNLGNLETVKKAITFTVPMPTDLPKVPEGYTRTFYIIREHDGKVELLETKEEEGKLVFESDKFSTYAIAYKDVENSGEGQTQPTTDAEKNVTSDIPQTGDNVVTYVVLAAVAMIGIVAFKRINKSKGKH